MDRTLTQFEIEALLGDTRHMNSPEDYSRELEKSCNFYDVAEHKLYLVIMALYFQSLDSGQRTELLRSSRPEGVDWLSRIFNKSREEEIRETFKRVLSHTLGVKEGNWCHEVSIDPECFASTLSALDDDCLRKHPESGKDSLPQTTRWGMETYRQVEQYMDEIYPDRYRFEHGLEGYFGQEGEPPMTKENQEQLQAYFEEISRYPDGTVSRAFCLLSPQNRIVALTAAPEELYRKFVAAMPLEDILTLTQGLATELIRYEDAVILGVFAQLQSLLVSNDTLEEERRKAEILINLYHAIDSADKKQSLLEVLEVMNVEAAETIRDSIVDEATLLRSDNQTIQRLLRELDNAELATFLSRASQELTEKLLGNMSSRMAEMLKEDMEFMGPVSDGAYKKASENIQRVYRLLVEAGVIIYPKRV